MLRWSVRGTAAHASPLVVVRVDPPWTPALWSRLSSSHLCGPQAKGTRRPLGGRTCVRIEYGNMLYVAPHAHVASRDAGAGTRVRDFWIVAAVLRSAASRPRVSPERVMAHWSYAYDAHWLAHFLA